MKLELKHLVPYLPYSLKLIVSSVDGSDYELLTGLISQNGESIAQISNTDYYLDDVEENDFSIAPILRPLSDLTKEIEVNGKKFVPMVKLLEEHLTIYTKHAISKCKYSIVEIFHETYKYIGGNHYNIKYIEPGDSSIKQLTYDDTFFRFTLRETNPVNRFLGMSYRNLDNMLLEWHFDVFGLIEKGLAIDINTLQNAK